MQNLEAILAILKSAGYLDCKLVNGLIIDKIKFLPLGALLLEKVRQECRIDRGEVNSYVMNAQNEEPVDLTLHRKDPFAVFRTNQFRDNILRVKNTFQDEAPLAIKEDFTFSDKVNRDGESFSVCLPRGTLISNSFFVNETVAAEYFYKIQRERKIWWMRFSANPGRYFLSDLTAQYIENSKIQTVKIKSKFNFGELDLETINVVPLRALGLIDLEDFQLNDVRLRRSIVPAVVRSELCLETAVLGILLDSVEDTHDAKISINRKIAPYQCSVFCFSKELDELAVHLTNVIRKAGLTTLNLRKCQMSSDQVLVDELKEMDHIGIPYSIILDEESLQTGVMKLRSRDTGLLEIIHITDVPKYLLKIFNL